ncbi:hypothetical protein D3C87_415660 [compost metagenome]
MSRWTDTFETHPFQSTWIAIKKSIDEQNVDDQTITTNVTELARLKKIIAYLDGMLQALDPELIPLNTWTSFQSQAEACLQQIQSYSSSRNIAHIQAANEHADNLLSYVRPYNVAPKHINRILQEAVKAYGKTINEYADSFRTRTTKLTEEIQAHKESSQNLYVSIESQKIAIDELHQELFNPETGIKDKVQAFSLDIEEKKTAITNYYNDVFVGVGEKLPIQKEVSSIKELVTADQRKILAMLNNTIDETAALSEFFTKIFGSQDDPTSEKDKGLSGQINDKVKELDAFEEKQAAKYQALNEQIESLLPGATSAGLASAYNEMKMSFDAPIKRASNIFYVAIGVLIFGSLVLAIDQVGPWSITFVRFDNWDTVLKSLAYKVPFYAPVLWLAFYATKRRSEYQRLQQEYAHKEALAKSYNNYKKQIDDLDSEDVEMQKMFIGKTIDAIAYNASATLDGKHGDKMPIHDFAEKILGKLDQAELIELVKAKRKP